MSVPDRRRVVTVEEVRALLADAIAQGLGLAEEARQLRAERDEARRTIARIKHMIGPAYVHMDSGAVEVVDLDVVEAVSGLLAEVMQAEKAGGADT